MYPRLLIRHSTGSALVPANDGYAEIKEIEEKLSITSEPVTAEMLIEKSRAFIKAHPKYKIDGDGIIRKTNLRGSALESAVAQLVQENMAR